jgi:glycosyltransferase involved in cell wall biosynthesis
MKVLQFSTSDQGGAGVVARVLNKALIELGVDSARTTLIQSDLRKEPFTSPLLTTAAILDEYLVKTRSTKTQISLFRAKLSAARLLENYKYDLLHLHGIEGMLNIGDISSLLSLGTPIVWTMHDMAPFTGICHHASKCNGYQQLCQSCPQARVLFQSHVENSLVKKIDLFSKSKEIVFVAPSNWLADRARKSSVLRDHNVRAVPNPVDSAFFKTTSRLISRSRLGLRDDSQVIAVVAKNLSDPNKQIKTLVEQFHQFRLSSKADSQLLIVGDGEPTSPLGANVSKYPNLSSDRLSELFCASDILVSGSLEESFGLTLSEAASVGTLVLATEGHGGSERIKNGVNGFLMASASSLAISLERIFELSLEERMSIAEAGKIVAQNQCHPKVVASRYKEIYEALLYGSPAGNSKS